MPVFGICYGQQTMASQLGGEVEGGHHSEFGRAEVEVLTESPIFQGVWQVGDKYPVWMSHGDRVTRLPDGFETLAVSPNAPFAVVADEKRKFYAVQFHPEVVHTPQGAQLIRNFVREIAGCRGDWTMKAFRDEAIERIRAQVGTGRVICGLSGGVDSAVAAVLIHEAIGDQLTCVFVDHGLMREAEAEQVVRCFATATTFLSYMCRHRISSSERWKGSPTPRLSARPSAASSSTCSTRKPKKIGGADFLAQGTLYPDVIESVSFTGGPSVTIKSHHNVGGLPERMNMKLVEPLRELFKDEVRVLGSRTRPARGLRGPASVPRSGPRHPRARARSPARSSTSCARPTRSIWTRSARPDSMTKSGRPSRCCCR